MKKALIGLFALGIVAYVINSIGLPYYQASQLEKLNAAQSAAFESYQASANPQEKAQLKASWLKLLDKKVEKKTVSSEEVRQAIAALNTDQPKDNKALFKYLTLLDVTRTPAEQVQYTYLLYLEHERQLTGQVKESIEKVLTSNPKQPNTLLILAEQALNDQDYGLVRKVLPVIKAQIPEKSELTDWAAKIELQLNEKAPAGESQSAVKPKAPKA